MAINGRGSGEGFRCRSEAEGNEVSESNLRQSGASSVASNRLTLGALALVVAGLTQLPTGILRAGVPSDPAQNLEFALGANSVAFRLGMALTDVSLAFFVLGLIALYAYLSRTRAERLTFLGLVMTVGFLVLFLPLIGFVAYMVPAIGVLAEQGQTEMIQVMDQTFAEPFILIPFLGNILWTVGCIPLGLAIWRSGRLWRWGGLLFILFGVIGIPAIFDVGVLQLVASVLLGLAQLTVGVALFRAVRGEAATSTAALESPLASG
jgi:hypothetical protein